MLLWLTCLYGHGYCVSPWSTEFVWKKKQRKKKKRKMKKERKKLNNVQLFMVLHSWMNKTGNWTVADRVCISPDSQNSMTFPSLWPDHMYSSMTNFSSLANQKCSMWGPALFLSQLFCDLDPIILSTFPFEQTSTPSLQNFMILDTRWSLHGFPWSQNFHSSFAHFSHFPHLVQIPLTH